MPILSTVAGFGTVLSCMKSKLRWKASLLNTRARKASLTEEDVEFLVTNTRFRVEDVREWYRQFILECPQVPGLPARGCRIIQIFKYFEGNVGKSESARNVELVTASGNC